ncbi:hypothetical protein HYFRA_00011883 [Hymenoscyphus fraxineus]|uniref:Uncharacterized protein n=1 Tax=Hymenoscyphus fraxineus TaxID=746836 RepID=A0A9N9KYD2_9HELO|nr:hypothetical protein HYFRA_00011883 [Hymenoscyphus fraxineus]
MVKITGTEHSSSNNPSPPFKFLPRNAKFHIMGLEHSVAWYSNISASSYAIISAAISAR